MSQLTLNIILLQNHKTTIFLLLKNNLFFFDNPILFIESLESTNDYLKDILDLNKKKNILVIANNQTNGKGQRGSSWISSPSKNILLSFSLCDLKIDISDFFQLSKKVSLAVCFSLNKFFKNENLLFKIKWPNDIILNDKKTGGILIENTIKNKYIDSAIVGIGLNVNDEQINNTIINASSIKIELNTADIDRHGILTSIIYEIENIFHPNNLFDINKLYKKNLYGFGESKIYEANNKRFNAIIYNIDNDGKLVLNINGEYVHFDFKEIKMIY